MEYDVTYQILSGVDGNATTLSESTIRVSAANMTAARLAAREWAFENDPYCDERIDPAVRISHARRVDAEQ